MFQATTHLQTVHPAEGYLKAMARAVTLCFEDVLSEIEGLHCLIGCCLGPDDGLPGMQFTEIYMLRCTKGSFANGSGCSMQWRLRGCICPVTFQYL